MCSFWWLERIQWRINFNFTIWCDNLIWEDIGYFVSFLLMFNLIVDIPSILVDSFDSEIIFHHLVWYGWACLEVESLYICHSMVYPSYEAEEHISLSMISRIHTNVVNLTSSSERRPLFYARPRYMVSPNEHANILAKF